MTEHLPEESGTADATELDGGPEAERQPASVTDEPLRTGNAQVDAVLTSLQHLDDRPVEEHVAVFERAHDGLRDALEARPESPDPHPEG